MAKKKMLELPELPDTIRKEIICAVDRSGSMVPYAAEVEEFLGGLAMRALYADQETELHIASTGAPVGGLRIEELYTFAFTLALASKADYREIVIVTDDISYITPEFTRAFLADCNHEKIGCVTHILPVLPPVNMSNRASLDDVFSL